MKLSLGTFYSLHPFTLYVINSVLNMIKNFQGVANVASVSLAIGYPTVASVPHSLVNGFKVRIKFLLFSSPTRGKNSKVLFTVHFVIHFNIMSTVNCLCVFAHLFAS